MGSSEGIHFVARQKRPTVAHRHGRSVGPRVAVIVEGKTELEAFRRLYGRVPGCPFLDVASRSRSDLGGVGGGSSPEAIGEKVARRAVMLAPDNDKVVVCIDREGRATGAGEFAASVVRAIQCALASLGELGIPIDVVVADRAFEAWILADIQGICRLKRVPPPRNRCYEGHQEGEFDFGAKLLKRILGRYDKAIDGPDLFALIDFGRARLTPARGRAWGSASLDGFLVALGI